MASQLGYRSSYAWRSIFQARGVLTDRVQWRVGNGEKIRIWKDSWLPPPCSTLVYSPHHRLDVDSQVSTLIDLMTGWWNTHLIDEIFTPEEAACICSVIPSPLQAPDSMIFLFLNLLLGIVHKLNHYLLHHATPHRQITKYIDTTCY